MKSTLFLASIVSMLALSCQQKANNDSLQIDLANTTKTNSKIMDNKSFTTVIWVEQSPAVAFNAIKNFRAWWSEEIEGNTDRLNETFFYHYKNIHLCKMKLITLVPDQKLVYRVLENEFNFVEDKTEWINTELIFEISTESNKTKIQFTHKGLVPEYACYNVCHDAWSGYINKSLYNLITTGKGEPNPKDKDGFNAALAEKWKLKSGE